MKPLELYVHYPFCVQKCRYCDFLSAPGSADVQERYVHALIKEIYDKKHRYDGYCVDSIFIGGGTPSLMQPELLKQVVDAIRDVFVLSESMEFTIEANPGTLTKDFVQTAVRCGVNRVSIGLQSANDEELCCLGRIHSFDAFCESFALARRFGIKNINVDLMSALPGQTVESWVHTLQTVADMNPEHISAYSLIIEEGTPFYDVYGDDGDCVNDPWTKPLPTEEDERQMYYVTEQILAEHGYERYEISNYSKPGMSCKHNEGYWRRKNYLGLGLGAASLIENERFSNTSKLKAYIAGWESANPVPYENKEKLSLKDQMEEFMFLGLRMMSGISEQEFLKNFGISVFEVYKDVIEKNCQSGLLENYMCNGETRLHLTRKGIDVSNNVMADFIFDE